MNHGHLSLECTRNFNRSCDVTCLRGAIESIINADNREIFNSVMSLCNPRSLQMSLELRIKSYNIVQKINHNGGVAIDSGHFSSLSSGLTTGQCLPHAFRWYKYNSGTDETPGDRWSSGRSGNTGYICRELNLTCTKYKANEECFSLAAM